MQISAQGQRVLGCLVEKALATPDQYPLSLNALRTACNQTTGRDPVVNFSEEDVRAGIDALKQHQLVKTEYARGSRVPKTAHRLGDQLDLDEAQQTVLALLLLRGPQTAGELRSRSGRMHTFGSVELVEAILGSLAAHRFGTLVELRPREPGRREARWAHLLGPAAESTATASAPSASSSGRYRRFHDAVLAGDWNTAVDQLARDVTFRSPAVHQPYEGRLATATILRAVAKVFEDFRYTDVLDEGDRAVLVFEARVGDRELQGIDLLRFDDDGLITDFTVMIRPLSGLTALAQRMQALLENSGTAP
ncbi:DUF480 domain-containing protein [Nitriliruptor alkaliphilus]|uniref:DUF480 domain-containing protein n=1 Tax=Nitriliruptor alkaliphilus TaxID=427918 RepID=UPI00069672DD|nr:DUF480 domain-containing protein [Nitriliruptor alkaliphilus]